MLFSAAPAMPLHEKKVVAVLPAYNAERTLQATYDDIPQEWVDEILLVDDCSKDRTVELRDSSRCAWSCIRTIAATAEIRRPATARRSVRWAPRSWSWFIPTINTTQRSSPSW